MKEVSVPALVPPATEGNLTDLLVNRAHFEPERVMLSRPVGEGWQPVSARTLEAEVRAVAKGLIAAGIKSGDRVGLLSRTRYEWTIMDFAIWFAGGVVVPVYETSWQSKLNGSCKTLVQWQWWLKPLRTRLWSKQFAQRSYNIFG